MRIGEVILGLANDAFGSTCIRISQGRSPHQFRCYLPFQRYVATEAKPDQVIYMDAGKGVNSFVYRVLINRTIEPRTEDRKSRFAGGLSSTATLGCAVL